MTSKIPMPPKPIRGKPYRPTAHKTVVKSENAKTLATLKLQVPFISMEHVIFCVEFMKDRSARRAAEAAGFSADYGHKLIKDKDIVQAISILIEKDFDRSMITSDQVLDALWDNHLIARQMGNITASNAALTLVGKHKRVDAFAADKVKITTDSDVIDRLTAARNRSRQPVEIIIHPEEDKPMELIESPVAPVSFM